MKVEPAGEGIKTAAGGVRTDGQAKHVEHTANYDGKDSPITRSLIADTVSLKRIDTNTAERTPG